MGIGPPKPIAPEALFHGLMMTIAWVVCEQIAIWALTFRNRSRWAIYIHGAAMLLTVMMTLVAATEIILYKGIQVIWKNWYHTLAGFFTSCLTVLVMILGFLSRIQQNSTKIDPQKLDKLKLAHITGGWLIIGITRTLIYLEWITKLPSLFAFLICFDFVAHILYVVHNFYRSRLESIQIIQKQKALQRDSIWIRKIYKLSDLEIYRGDYFIFADEVYRLSGVFNAHPGGSKIIEQVRGRQVDRFLYGIEPLQKFENIRVSHTADSIKLAGPPLAKIEETGIYSRLQNLNSARISALNFYQSQKKIYTVYIRPNILKSQAFKYSGYTNISQLGKYFVITIGNCKTRMYTMVNFLQPRTIKLVQLITKGQVFSQKQRMSLQRKGFQSKQLQYFQSIRNWQQTIQTQGDRFQEQLVINSQKSLSLSLVQEDSTSDKYKPLISNHQENQKEQVESISSGGKKYKRCFIPLLIKKYQDGQFTSFFLRQNFKDDFIISCPRGRGLALQDLQNLPKPYNLILFSGGTGIYPFSDLIDLLFKDLLLQKQLLSSDQLKLKHLIIRNNQILQKNPFKDYNVTLYISVPMLQQIHPITLFECEFLALHKKVKIFFKSNHLQDYQTLKERYPHIEVSNQRYEKLLWQMKQSQISRIYICGPTRMTKALLIQLQRLSWNPQKYVVL